MLYAILNLANELRRLTKALQDNSSATNANSIRVDQLATDISHLKTQIHHLTMQLAASAVATTTNTDAISSSNALTTALIPLLLQLVESLNQVEAAFFTMTLANSDGSDAVQGDSPMAVQLPDDTGPKLLTLVPRDKKGAATVLDGPATFASSDPAVATATPQSDLVARIDFLDTSRPVQIQFSGDARMGADVVPISGTLDITFTAGEAASFDAQLTDAPPA